jgi:hypothetical protein
VATRDHVLFGVESAADLRSSSALAAIGRELDRDPNLRMERFGTNDPPRTPIESAETALREWRPGAKFESGYWWFHLSRKGGPRGRATIQITTLDPTKQFYAHSVYPSYLASWFDTSDRLDEIADLLRRLAEATGAFYGRAALGAIYDQYNLRLDHLPPLDDECEIPDVYWLNYFGPGYVEFFGARLERIGVRRTRTKTGGVLVWATETPFVLERVSSISEYAFKQPFYEALGRDTFRSETQHRGEPGERVPTFEVHRRYASVDRPRPSVKARSERRSTS